LADLTIMRMASEAAWYWRTSSAVFGPSQPTLKPAWRWRTMLVMMILIVLIYSYRRSDTLRMYFIQVSPQPWILWGWAHHFEEYTLYQLKWNSILIPLFTYRLQSTLCVVMSFLSRNKRISLILTPSHLAIKAMFQRLLTGISLPSHAFYCQQK
jgi:hypothetical protein